MVRKRKFKNFSWDFVFFTHVVIYHSSNSIGYSVCASVCRRMSVSVNVSVTYKNKNHEECTANDGERASKLGLEVGGEN